MGAGLAYHKWYESISGEILPYSYVKNLAQKLTKLGITLVSFMTLCVGAGEYPKDEGGLQKMRDDLTGRQIHRKMTSQEDDITER